MYDIPTEILIGDKYYPITNKGDYRTILGCFAVLEDVEMTKAERILSCLMVFYEDLNDESDLYKMPDLETAATEMFKFFNGGSEQPTGANLNHKVIDWEQDSQMICSAINNVAHTEIRSEPYIHWWTFLGYYMAIGESPLSTVVSIRDKILKGKKLEKHEQEFRRNNPQYFVWNNKSVEDQELDAYVKDLWNADKVGT